MVDFGIMKQKIETVSTLIKITKWVGLILIVMNVLGWAYKRIDFTIALSLIIIILLWLWTLDTQVNRIEKLLKDKDIMKGGNGMKNNKKGLTDVGKWIIWILVALAVIFILSKIFS